MHEQEQKSAMQREVIERRGLVPTPKEPGIADRLKELRGYLYELADTQQSMRGVLFRAEPCDQSANTKLANESVEELAAICCEHAAMLVSESRSIRNRL